jgi:1,4-alpha-glucan branching enzyme
MLKRTAISDGRRWRVTFELPRECDAASAVVCGDFNDWSTDSHPLTQRKDGRFSVTIDLAAGRSYRFRYLIDGERWENDWEADTYVPNVYGGEDSVLDLNASDAD